MLNYTNFHKSISDTHFSFLLVGQTSVVERHKISKIVKILFNIKCTLIVSKNLVPNRIKSNTEHFQIFGLLQILLMSFIYLEPTSIKVETPKCNTSRSQTPRKEPKSKGKWTQR